MRIFKNSAKVVALTLFLSSQAYATSSITSTEGDAEKGKEIAAGVCAGCHNADGNSIIPNNPILAGQIASYTAKQLMNFKEGEDGKPAKRVNAIMAPMVAALSEDDMKDLAAYYAQQTPQPGMSNDKNKKLMELGEIIYRSGNLENEVPACASCHSPNGSGLPPHYPRLAGQHADYTYAQLMAFNNYTRANDNKVMQQVVSRLSNKEKRAVAEFITKLK
ncbi:MAG: cytochrome c4 [Nitrosomonas sp.]|nr:cytochrome c4 [Nitrosomonas sp.]